MTMLTYKCGCVVPDAGGHHATACVRHGRIVDVTETTPAVPTYPVLFTRDELTALATWLRGQTFPYDEPHVHTGAARIMHRTSEEA